MRPLVPHGEYTVIVDDSPAGFLRVSSRLFWFLGPQWSRARPSAFTLKRTGAAMGPSAWKARVGSAGIEFGRGFIGAPDGAVPQGLRPSGFAFELPILDTNPDDGQGYLQIDPGVIGVWTGDRARLGTMPDHGFGYVATDGQNRFIEAFVPRVGATPAAEVTLKVLERNHHALDAQRAFRTRTEPFELDFDAGNSMAVQDYRREVAFWRAIT